MNRVRLAALVLCQHAILEEARSPDRGIAALWRVQLPESVS
jgi:hypothetical protein